MTIFQNPVALRRFSIGGAIPTIPVFPPFCCRTCSWVTERGPFSEMRSLSTKYWGRASNHAVWAYRRSVPPSRKQRTESTYRKSMMLRSEVDKTKSDLGRRLRMPSAPVGHSHAGSRFLVPIACSGKAFAGVIDRYAPRGYRTRTQLRYAFQS
jgi:hypothetical protein